MARFCTACGTTLVGETARFCTKCGSAVGAPPDSSVAIIPPSVSGSGRSKTYLMLEGAKVLETHGHGGGIPKSGLYTVKFEDEGIFAVYYKGLFGEFKKTYWAHFGRVEFYVGTVAIKSGGGWVGGGFGVRGALRGAMTASLLNALTTKNREYAVLTINDYDNSGAQKHASLGFLNLDEAALRNKLAQAIPAWTEPVVNKWEDSLKQGKCKKDEAIKFVDRLKLCLERGILSEEQADRLFVFLKEIAPEAFPKPISQATSATRVEQLKTLSDLRNSGALSEAEFQAEKQLVLQGSRS